MAQTGINNAVGIGIESKFREVPLSLDSGVNYHPGIPDTNPLRFFIVNVGAGFVGKPDIQAPANEIDGDVQQTRTWLTGKEYSGKLPFPVDGENAHYPLLATFGRVISSVFQADGGVGGAVGVNEHAFYPYQFAPSLFVEEHLGDGTHGRLSSGICSPSLNLVFGETLMATWNLTPYRQVPNWYRDPANSNIKTRYRFGKDPYIIPAQMGGVLADGANTWTTNPVPGYIDVEQEQPQDKGGSGPFVFAEMVHGLAGGVFDNAYMTIGGDAVDVVPLEGFTVDCMRKIDANKGAGGGYEKSIVTGSQVEFKGKMPLLFEDMNIPTDVLNHEPIGFNFSILGNIIGAAPGTAQYLIDVYLPNIRLTVPDGPEATDGPMQVGGTYVARRDPSLGYACRMILRNTFDMTNLAGKRSTNPGGLGGWVSE